MSDIQLPTQAGVALTPRTARVAGRVLGNIQVGAIIDLARIDAAVQRRETATDGTTAITARAMQHVALIAQSEQSLGLTVPGASGRLAAVADAHALAMTAIVIDTAHALKRLV